ncbi:MAG: hypothetical protein ACTSQ8_18895 [Candidatus Helarchaeota archaeon]
MSISEKIREIREELREVYIECDRCNSFLKCPEDCATFQYILELKRKIRSLMDDEIL